MKLDDFLKCKKVRCVNNGGLGHLTEGKEYEIKSIDYISVFDNDGDSVCVDTDWFEPVLDSAENPLQDMKLTPEFESAETVLVYNCEVNTQDNSVNTQDNSVNIQDTPKFRVGDKVYAPSVGAKVYTLKDFGYGWVYPIRIDCDYDEDHEFTKEGQITAEGLPILFLATELNHSLLSQLYGIDFERPPLTGSDLCRAMLKKGWKYVPCFVSNESDDFAQKMKLTDLIIALDGDRSKEFVGDDVWHFAVPFDPRTGEPLTQAVLDE